LMPRARSEFATASGVEPNSSSIGCLRQHCLRQKRKLLQVLFR
jgi:hypothetical protein